jgi:hypothetical protein
MAALRKCLALAVVLATMGAAPVSADVPDPVVDDTAAPVTVTFDPEWADAWQFEDDATVSRSSWG